MENKKSNIKTILLIILAIAGFVVILLSCMQLRTKGIPILIGLIVHTCAMLLLYYGALSSLEDEEWEDEENWLEDIAQKDHPKEDDKNPYNIPEAEAFEDEAEYVRSHPSQKQNEEEAFFKDVYAEVRESLIDSPAQVQEIVEEIADEISSETILPSPEEGTVAAVVIPDALHTFLARPKNAVEMDLIAAAKDAMESLQAFAEKQNIKLHLSTTCETLMMKADPDSIRILFRNIIDNSIKYMGRPGHMIITISLLGDDIFLILKDTGNGLSEEETTHVFELNFQGSNRVSGNGLGLTQTKMIVEAFGGTIYAKSSPGNGMAIYIQLPVSGSTAL